MLRTSLLGSALSVLGCSYAGPLHAPRDADLDAAAEADGEPGASLGSVQLCKLLSNRNTSDPTTNDVQHRANVLGADLGIPVVQANRLYLLFGDTIGYAGIWGGGDSHPDAVGHATDDAAMVAAHPELLCSDLRIATLAPQDSTGPHVDPSVQADFAAGFMTAPSGHTLGEYIRNPAGDATVFPSLPGDFEVPSGAFAYGDSIYVFYTTVISRSQPDMKASYLARWTNPGDAAPPYQILYAVDERFDGNGALGGNFINIAAEVWGDYVYLFGTGDYRRSAIHLARKRLDALATPGGFEDLGTIIATPGYGETSVRYFPELATWMLLAEELRPASNRIVAYTAPAPEGPWSAPQIIHDMADPAFRSAYCCAIDDNCEGQQMFDCDRTGFYGSYLLPGAVVRGPTFTIAYTLSSFAPYNVALFQTTLAR
jgi:hypothetical protein